MPGKGSRKKTQLKRHKSASNFAGRIRQKIARHQLRLDYHNLDHLLELLEDQDRRELAAMLHAREDMNSSAFVGPGLEALGIVL